MSGTFDELLERFQAGEATAAEIAALEALLRSDAGNRRRLVDATLLEVQLHKAFGGIVPAIPAPPVPARRWHHVATFVVAAAILLVLGGLTAYLVWPAGPASQLDSGQVRIASHVASDRVPHGERFEVAGDVPAVLRLSDGSRAALEPHTQGIVHGQVGEVRQVIELAEGGGTFTVQKGDSKFRVDTPVGSVTALGTEFTVKLRPGPKKNDAKSRMIMAVSVAEGSVRVNADGKEQVLAAGTGRAFGDDGNQNNRDDGQQNNNNQKNQGNQGSQK